jgi:mRNA-degrading endonuclease RelE of RelBE toxin-antitoxin system
MNVKRDRSVDFAIRTLTETERQKVFAWFDHLANWENDPDTREASRVSSYENVLVLTTSDDFRISFSLDQEKGEITVLDISRPSRFEAANHSPCAG